MTTIKRYTTSNSTNSESGSNTYPKGSMSNPYTVAEYEAIPEEEWKGGHVEGMGYVPRWTEVIGSYPSSAFSDNYSDWLSDWNWGEYSHPFSHMGSAPEPGGGGGNGGNNQNPNTPKPDSGNHGNGETGNGNTQTEDEHGYLYTFDENGCYNIEKTNNPGVYIISAGGETIAIDHPLKIDEDEVHGIQFKATYDTFVLLANHTNVEWAASFNEDGTAYINTSNEHSIVDIPTLSGYNNVVHSHPEGTDIDGPDLEIYGQILMHSCLTDSFSYQKFFLYRNGQLEEKTRDVWKHVRNNPVQTRYERYKNQDPYK